MRKTTLVVALVATLCIAGTARADLANGLLNYWDFNGNLDDTAGNYPGNTSTGADNGFFTGTNGTGGIGYGAGKFGGAGIEQDGASGAQQNNGVVEVTASADTHDGVAGNLTVSMWFNTAGWDSNWQTLIAHGEQNNWRMARRSNENGVAIAMGASDVPNPGVGDQSAGTGWHHIVGISEAGVSMRIYVDGTLNATGAAPNITDPNGRMFIGGNPDTGGQNREWWGEIDDVAMWDRVLNEEEIGDLYFGGLGGDSLGDQIVPEPTSALLAILGVMSLGFSARRRRRNC